MKTVLFGVLSALGVGAGLIAILGNHLTADRTYGPAKVALKLSDPAIDESSGVARSYTFSGKVYTHNDSGDTAQFWRFDLKGSIEGPYNLKGAAAVDWEDMASARIGDKDLLYFGDIGDNASKRSSITVYRVEEPIGKTGDIARFDTFELTYPDNPHNAEALLVHPSTGEMDVVTKSADGTSGVYRLVAGAKPGRHKLEKIGELKFDSILPPGRLVTGGDVSADGKHVVLRTYLEGYEFDVPARFSDWIRSKRRAVGLALEPQGEAIGYSLDGTYFITTSEHAPCQISTIPIKP